MKREVEDSTYSSERRRKAGEKDVLENTCQEVVDRGEEWEWDRP